MATKLNGVVCGLVVLEGGRGRDATARLPVAKAWKRVHHGSPLHSSSIQLAFTSHFYRQVEHHRLENE